MAKQLCGRWGRPQLYQKVGKGRDNNGLYWEIKKAVIVSCTGKSGLLKASRMCPGLLVVLGSSLPDCFATCASRS